MGSVTIQCEESFDFECVECNKSVDATFYAGNFFYNRKITVKPCECKNIEIEKLKEKINELEAELYKE